MVRFIYDFVCFTIISFLTNTYAYWLPDKPIANIELNTEKTCYDWLIIYGFHETNVAENRVLARYRDRQIDDNIFVWAVMYAHELTGYRQSNEHDALLVPNSFCESRGFDRNKLTFSALKNFQNTCEGWILVYRYHMEFTDVNHDVAMSRNIEEDKFIFAWTAQYAHYLSKRNKRHAITLEKFCKNMVENGKLLNFMSLYDTRMTCREWIELTGFNNNNLTNLKKANKFKKEFDDYRNSWTQLYIEYLRDFRKKIIYFCCGSAGNVLLSPLSFCESRGYTELAQLTYYEEHNDESISN